MFSCPPPLITVTCRSRLLQFNNELFHIQITSERHVILSVVVHQLEYFSQIGWERVKSMKDKVFFLSANDLPFVCQAINPEAEGGRIYLTLENSKFVYIYSVEDNRLIICHAFSNLPTEVCRSLWFRSDLSMTFSLQEKKEKRLTRVGNSSAEIHSKRIVDITTNCCAFPLEALLPEMSQEVATKLNVLDYLHFRATSGFFRSRVLPLQWRSHSHSLMSFFDDLSLSPLLVFVEKENVLTFVHPKHGIKYKYSINLPEDMQGGCKICYLKEGWLLLTVNRMSNMFFNPFTREVTQLACGPEPSGGSTGVTSLCLVTPGFQSFLRKKKFEAEFSHPPWDTTRE
ncbi:uncharacterized protein LOC130746320 isoform X3 [Lotus japonicus]|uniref:uncharacterized protein LOC130746320 isoform X3 n=1 Tax=Lotus japonicus TaxID=34305 RepID=UPI00258C35F3|nr:uncharacterized protein LOC130746320 isoform X3 [Lotus japonicus]